MRRTAAALLAALIVAVPASAARANEGGLSPERFEHPRADSRPTILWFWNGTITNDLIDEQLADMRAEGVREVVIFPDATSTLTPAFFSEGWFDVVGHTLREAQRTGMHVWLFNDRNFPSGRAAGIVANGGTVGNRTYQPHPELRAESIGRTKVDVSGGASYDVRDAFPGLVPSSLSISGGRLTVDGGNVTVLSRGTDWTDYTYSFDTRPLQTGSLNGHDYAQAGWIARAPDSLNGYIYLLGNYPHAGATGGNLTRITFKDGANTGTKVIKLPFDVVSGHSYHVETRVEGDHVVTTVDGTVVDDITDSTYAHGTIGFREATNQGESATFDNLRVTAPDGTLLYSQTFDSEAALTDFGIETEPEDVIGVAALPVRDGKAGFDGLVDLTDDFRSGRSWDAPEGPWQVEYYVRHTRTDFGGSGYLNILDPEATRRYIQVVHDEYYRRFAWAFQSGLVRGFWDDEPRVSADEPPWSDLVGELLGRAGSTPARAMAAVFGRADRGEGSRARGAYWHAEGDAFAQAYYRPQGQWATAHQTRMISNAWGDDRPPTFSYFEGGDLHKNDQWFQVPGGDAIYGRVAPGLHNLSPRYVASDGHQQGSERILHENLGAYGWDVTPGLARYVNGAMGVRGVNLTVFHAFWSNPESVRYPPPLEPTNPWWDDMDGVVDWTGRVMELTRAKAVAPTALLHPITAAEAWQDTDAGDALDDGFNTVAFAMEDAQVDYDVLDEAALDGDPAMRRQAVVRGDALRMGPQSYRTVVMPPAPTISLEAVQRLQQLVDAGGRVIAYGELPTHEAQGRDDALQAALATLFSSDRARRVRATDELEVALGDAGAPAAKLLPASPDVRALRVEQDGDRAFLLMNEGQEAVDTTATLPAAGTPEIWDPADGSHGAATRFHATGGGSSTTLPLHLEPGELLGVVFRERAPAPHLLRSALPATSVQAEGDGLTVHLVADRAGDFDLIGADGPRRYAGTVHVAGSFEPIELGGDWRFRFDRPGADWSERALGSWTEVDPAYSGDAVYERDLELAPGDLASGRRLLLDLGDVRDVAHVTVNGTPAGRLLWAPYRLDVTRLLRPGANTISVTVTNTPANEHGERRESGLLGPVALLPRQEVTARLEPLGDGEQRDRLVALDVVPGSLRLLPCQTATLQATVTNYSLQPVAGTLSAAVDAPLTVAPAATPVALRGGDARTVTLTVAAPGDATGGEHPVTVSFGDRRVAVPVTVPADYDLARAGTPSASSTHSGFTVGGAVDGDTSSDDWGAGNGWNDGTSGQFPDTFTIELACPSPVHEVDVWTLDSARYPASRYGVRDYDVQARVDAAWRTVDSVTGNTEGMRASVFDPVTADAVRLVIGASNDGGYSRLIEVGIPSG